MRLVNYVFPDGTEAPALVIKEDEGRLDLLVVVYDNRFGAGQPLYLAVGIAEGGKGDKDSWHEQRAPANRVPKKIEV